MLTDSLLGARLRAKNGSDADLSIRLARAAFHRMFSQADERFSIRYWNGDVQSFGEAPLDFTIHIKDPRALKSLDEDSIIRGYYEGYWDIEGSADHAISLRRYVSVRNDPLHWLSLMYRVFAVPESKNNVEAITAHYQFGDDFYLSFLDKDYRIYSHGHFRNDSETLEQSQEHKLADAFEMVGAKPGMRILDIGGGWGPVPQYFGERGVKVTSVTLAPDSHRYISNMIRERQLDCEVVHSDFLDYEPAQPFDAVIIFGVIEHIPQYRRFIEKVRRVLKPGGLMYLDGSATRCKYDMGMATKQEVWPTTTAYLSLHDLIAELNYQGMDILQVHNESRDYELTMWHWATRFEQNRSFIVEKWGERLYRIFHMYLWGGCHNFRYDGLQAYRVLIRRGMTEGPAPGSLRRAVLWAWSAR
ncbi:MAG TPA: class I SAM-dependent methyltransferase [Polyangiaceae bacterium]|jgi:cyclopropane-fatty-acyl-phospholipid synthase